MHKLKYFTEQDFTMDGRDVSGNMNPDFLVKLDLCREIAGVVFTVLSSFRTKAKNKAVGGAMGSLHLEGRAVDVRSLDGTTRGKIVRAALSLGLSVGIMENAVHIDDREDQILFHYYAQYTRKGKVG